MGTRFSFSSSVLSSSSAFQLGLRLRRAVVLLNRLSMSALPGMLRPRREPGKEPRREPRREPGREPRREPGRGKGKPQREGPRRENLHREDENREGKGKNLGGKAEKMEERAENLVVERME